MSNKRESKPPANRGELPLEQILAGRRLLLIGATGFLGKTLLYALLRHHPEIARIYLLIRGDRRTAHNRYQREVLDSQLMEPLRAALGDGFDSYMAERLIVVSGDIAQEGLLSAEAEPLARGALDAVLNCAGLVNFEASLEKALVINTLGVANIVDFCRKLDTALLHVSTCYVAGSAEGHRYEEEIPEDWCPNERKNFTVRREMRDARAAIDRIEAASREQARLAQFRTATADDGTAAEDHADGPAENRRKEWVEERLRADGLARALRWGWPNSYSYTKSMGEQLVLAARNELDVVVVRPPVIESALADPFPGWNQGANTSAPLTYLAGEGFRFYPARADLVLDMIPVDMVAHAMVPILAALLTRSQEPIYQLGTSDINPLTMRRLVELVGLSHRVYQRDGIGTLGKLAPHLEAVVVSNGTYEFASQTVPALLKRAVRFAKSVVGADSRRTNKLELRLAKIFDQLTIARSLVKIYRPYIQEYSHTFHGRNIRALYRRLSASDLKAHPYHPEKLDWLDYWVNVHVPGLRRHIFPQLELHTRGRTRAPRRFRNLIELLETSATRFGARPATIAFRGSGQETALSYRELRDRAQRAGLMLAGRGVKPGDRVLLIGENSPDWVVAFFSILYAGAVAVPLDQQLSAPEMAAIGAIAEPAAALCSANARGRLGEALEALPGAPLTIGFEELARPFLLRHTPPDKLEVERKTLAAIFFTSGSTGNPKGVMLSHGNLSAEVSMLARGFALSEDDAVLSLLPLHHTFEFTCGMLLPLAGGSRLYYPIGLEASNLAATLAQVRPTALIGVPALWQAIHRRINDEIEARGVFMHAGFDQLRALNRRLATDLGVNLGSVLFRAAHNALGGRLRLAVSGGAALPNRVAEFFNDLGIRLLEGFGLTEAGPVLSVAMPDEPPVPGSVGKPLSGVEIKLLHGSGETVGEIIARGPNIMSGYYRDPDATAAALFDGWLHTGDLGRFDDAGRLYIVGRAKDVIVDAGGNNIYIDEVEETYSHSPYLKELAVVGLKIHGGEQVAALAVPAYARGQSRRHVQDQLQAHFAKVSAGLNSHRRIKILRFIDTDLPRTRTRKIKRGEVAALLDRMLAQTSPAVAQTAMDVEPWLLEALAAVAGAGSRITATTRLIEDLGLDSLALAELGEHVAEHSGRELSPEELGNLRTVEDLQRTIADRTTRPKLPSYAQFSEPFTLALPAPIRRAGEAAAESLAQGLMDRWLTPRVLGRGNIPANRNVLIIANHSSHLDFALVRHALGPLGTRLVVLAARDYFFNTSLRRFLATNFTPLIPFDRERAQLESLEQALAQLAGGRSVLLFPEGTRSSDGTLQEFKSGAGYLALRSGCDILPIHIRGSYQVLGKGSLLPHRHPVEVRIGAVIANEGLRDAAQAAEGAGAYRSAADFMRQAVESLAAGRVSQAIVPAPVRPTRRKLSQGRSA